VLRSPGREEYTRLVFYGGRGFNTRPPAKNGRATRFAIDSSYSSLLKDVRPRAPETADVFIPNGEPLKLRIFVDRSVVEVFANGRQYAAIRVYPSRADSLGVSLRSQGTDTQVRSLAAWQMKNIYAAGP
jgi:beta-fructofuranosidase